MKKIFTILATIILVFQFSNLLGQNTYHAIKTGLWTDPTMWSLTSGGPPAGAVPGALDQVNTDGFSINVNAPGLACKDLLVDVNTTGPALVFSFFPSFFLTINGSLVGVDNSFGFPVLSPPKSNLFSGRGWLYFTGNNVGDLVLGIFNFEVIYAWSSLTPIYQATFNISNSNSNTVLIDGLVNGLTGQPDNLTVTNAISILAGTIDAPATLALGIACNNLIINNGSLKSNSYINSNIITINSTGSLITSYIGAGQTEGWWNLTSRPNTFNLSGSVEYIAGSDQNIYVVPIGYGDLILGGSGNKTLNGAGALSTNGDFEIGSAVTFVGNGQPISVGGDFTNDAAWASNVNMIFDGSSDQTITSISPLTFNSTIQVSNITGTVSLGAQNINLIGNLEIAEDASFSPGARNVTLDGDILATGNLLAGTGTSTFTFAATTNCSGTGAAFNHFNLPVGSTFNGPSGGPISVAGDFSGDGTFNNNNGTVTFNGSGSQSISETGGLEFNNLNVNNTSPATVNINGNVDLVGALTLETSSSRFDADGSGSGVLTLKSSSLNQDAQIMTLPTPSNLLGNVTVERYVNGVSDVNNNWRYLSVPLTNANVGMWQSVFPVTGNFSNPSTSSPETPITDPSAASIYYWDGSGAPFWYTLGSGASTGTTSLENGRGYSAYTFRTSDFVVSTRGTVASGGISKSIAANAWALMGNPYPSTIDWDDMSTTGLYASVYIRNVNGSYATYVKGGSSGSNHPNGSWAGEISLGQSFWVYSEGATSVNFSEFDKTTSPNYQFLREGDPEDLIKITLSSDIQDDEIIVRFGNEFIDGFDSQEDALKFRNGDYQSDIGIYSYINLSSFITNPDEDMAINSIPFVEDCNKKVYLKIVDVIEGEHKLKFTNIEAFNMGYDISLVDNFTDEITEVQENTEYAFQVTSDSASFGSDRFEVIFEADIIDRSYDFLTNNECSQSYVSVTIDNAVAGAVYEIYNNGEVVGDPATAESNQVTLPVSKDLLAIGETIFDLNSTIGSCESFTQDAFIVQYDSIYAITGVEDGISCGPGQVILQASGAPVDGFYYWYENETDTEPIPNEAQAELILDELIETKTYYVVAVNSIGCESTLRRAVTGIIADIPGNTPETSEAETTCINSGATLSASGAPPDGYYIWYDSNENVIEGENDNTYITPPLSDTTTFYVALANDQGCAGEKVDIEVPVIVLETPIITEDNGVLYSSIETGNRWYRDEELIEGATGSSYDTELEAGSYTVENSDGTCTVMSEPIEIEGVTGLDDVEVSDLIKLFPNPASDHLYVEYNVPSQEKVRLLVYSTSGRLVDSSTMDVFNNGHKFVLDITRYSKGMYITVVYDGENYVYSRFSKQ